MKLFLFALVLALCATANAQTYPTKMIRIVMPFVLILHPSVPAKNFKEFVALVKVIAQQTIRDRFAELGATTLGNSPAEFAEYIKQYYAKWQKVVKAANIGANQNIY